MRNRGVLALLMAAGTCFAQAPGRPPADREADAFVADLVGPGRLPGLACAAIVDGELAYEKAAGVRRLGYPEAIEPDDAFHLGSDTKAMTALLAGMMVDEGRLRWSSTIGETLGSSLEYDPAYSGVTLEQLLSHESGLASELPRLRWLAFFFEGGDPSAQAARIAEAALRIKPASEPGKAFAYSNFNYVVAGLMLEKASGLAWEALARRRIFDPLGMRSAGFGAPPAVWGHGPEAADPESRTSDNPPGLDAAGRVHASLRDVEAYVAGYFEGGRGDGEPRPVSNAAMAEITRPRLADYALGWNALPGPAGERILVHDGSNTKFYCSIVIVPERRFAVIALANRGDEAGSADCVALREYLVARFYPKPGR